MPYYYVNKNAQAFPENEEHEVHQEGCPTPPLVENRLELGYFPDCQQALAAAKKYYNKVDGCAHCVPQCHKI